MYYFCGCLFSDFQFNIVELKIKKRGLFHYPPVELRLLGVMHTCLPHAGLAPSRQ